MRVSLIKFPNQFNLLNIASDIYRALGDHEKSLECSILLISYYPKKWNGYGRAAQELITFRRFEEAQNKVQAGLEKIPNNFNLLNIASDAFRASKDLIKSLEYAELLATHHPKNWQSILKKSECLCELGKLDQAKIFLDQELKNNSANFSLSAKQLQLSKLFSSSDEIIDISSDIRLNFPERKEGFEETIKSRLSREINKESIDEIRIEYREKCSKKSQFINGLNCWEKNMFKSFWINSFLEDLENIEEQHKITHQPFQYWSQGSIPSDLAHLQRMWNVEFEKIEIKPIKIFDKNSALAWIKDNTPKLLTAFETAPHYAIEADVFRIAYASHNDCIYLDIDSYPLPKSIHILRRKISTAETTLLFTEYKPYILNGVFATRKESPFFAQIENEYSGFSFQNRGMSRGLFMDSFGPGRFSATVQRLTRAHSINKVPTMGDKTCAILKIGEYSINFNSYNFVAISLLGALTTNNQAILGNVMFTTKQCLPGMKTPNAFFTLGGI